MGYKCAIIVVKDIHHSRYLYENILQLSVTEDYGIYSVAFAGGLAMYGKDFFEQLISSPVSLNKQHNVVLYFEVDNLEEVEGQVAQSGLEFLHKIKEQPWKQRNFRFYDYDSHVIEIAEKMMVVFNRLSGEGKTIEEISQLTSVPKEQIMREMENQ